MNIIDFFKKSKLEKEEEKKIKPNVEIKKEKKEKPVLLKQEKKVEKKETFKKEKKEINIAYRVLDIPHISEKATDLVDKNQYTFRVLPRSNKKEIKEAVENLYGVDVLNVRTIKIPRRKKRRGKILGWKKGYKKAIVKIKEGQNIELLPK